MEGAHKKYIKDMQRSYDMLQGRYFTLVLRLLSKSEALHSLE